ncbi:MAG: anti-sigma factor [Acidobacteria bacterium]|nr:anti-sigma factor [Acidobacteriota bacterium]
MRCEEVQELLALHALDALERGDAEEVRRHLESGCPRCAGELAAFTEAQAAIPFALPAQEPSPMAKARLMAAVRKDALGSPRAGRAGGAWGRAGLAAAAAAIVVAILTGSYTSRRYELQTRELRAQIRSQQEELVRLEQQFRRTRDTILLVRSPGSKVIDLQGQEGLATAAARVFWDVRRGTWRLYADNLPPAGEGKTYQLWLVTAKEKISAGVFDPLKDEEPSGTVTVPPEAGAVVAAAVTPEPAGGSPQPTGSILLLGKI